MSGACITEIATFDEFSALLADGAAGWDHIVFDTAPTGHTLRLLSLPKARTGFLQGNDRGASCLGPHSGLEMQEARFERALVACSLEALGRQALADLPPAPRDLPRDLLPLRPFDMVGLLALRALLPGTGPALKSLLAAEIADPVLAARLAGEQRQIERMRAGLGRRLIALPWLPVSPIGLAPLSRLVGDTSAVASASG